MVSYYADMDSKSIFYFQYNNCICLDINISYYFLMNNKNAEDFKDILIKCESLPYYSFNTKDYKKITGFENSKTVLQDIELQLPDFPNIKDFNKLMLGRDEKIEELIIKPKDKIILSEKDKKWQKLITK